MIPPIIPPNALARGIPGRIDRSQADDPKAPAIQDRLFTSGLITGPIVSITCIRSKLPQAELEDDWQAAVHLSPAERLALRARGMLAN